MGVTFLKVHCGSQTTTVEGRESSEAFSIVQARDVDGLNQRGYNGDGEKCRLLNYMLDIEWMGLVDEFIQEMGKKIQG